ncbi:MAG: hypothetical protein ACOCRK_06275, partial [bacterium]
DFHASVYSSSHYEAISLGTPTAVLELDGWENVSDLLDNKIAIRISSPNNFVNLIEHILKESKYYKDWFNETNQKRDSYFKRNGIRNLVDKINSVVKGEGAD